MNMSASSLFMYFSFLFCLVGLVHGKDYVMNQNGVTWDMSCAGAKQQAIIKAWEGALELGDSSWNRFNTYTRPLVEQGPLKPDAQQYINKKDPAYVQMFALEWSPEGVSRIKRVLSNFVNRANSPPGTNGRPDWDESWLNIACPLVGQKDCESIDVAVTVNKRKGGEWTSTDMDFCPEFFKVDKFADYKAAASRPVPQVGQIDELHEQVNSLFMDPNYYGTDANRLYHELTHVWWIGPTNLDDKRNVDTVEEEYGWTECADLTWNAGCVTHNSPDVIWNADHYAWYAEYGYWADRGLDSWPEKDRPVKLPIVDPE